MNYWWLRHHFESFIVAALIWSTFVEYQCHKWPRICSVGRYHNPVLSSFLTYHRTCNKDNTMGDTRGTGTAYARGAHEFTPNFNCLCGVRVVCGVKLHVFMCFVLCCDVRCDFCVTRCSVRLFKGIRVLFMLYAVHHYFHIKCWWCHLRRLWLVELELLTLPVISL